MIFHQRYIKSISVFSGSIAEKRQVRQIRSFFGDVWNLWVSYLNGGFILLTGSLCLFIVYFLLGLKLQSDFFTYWPADTSQSIVRSHLRTKFDDGDLSAINVDLLFGAKTNDNELVLDENFQISSFE